MYVIMLYLLVKEVGILLQFKEDIKHNALRGNYY